jgi:hypothetical protein
MTPRTLISFVDLLAEAEAALGRPDLVFEERVNRTLGYLYAETILPTRRACQHERSHRQFAAAVLIAAENDYEIEFFNCRSTTLLAVVASASMVSFADAMVCQRLFESDSAKFKALNRVNVTSKLLKELPQVTLEDLI